MPTQIQSQKRKTGIIAPKRFVQRLKRDNELFRSYMHQVSHSNLPFSVQYYRQSCAIKPSTGQLSRPANLETKFAPWSSSKCVTWPMQDAHEFLNYLLNECSELLEKEAKACKKRESASEYVSSSSAPAQQQQQADVPPMQPEAASSSQGQAPPATWVHELFQV